MGIDVMGINSQLMSTAGGVLGSYSNQPRKNDVSKVLLSIFRKVSSVDKFILNKIEFQYEYSPYIMATCIRIGMNPYWLNPAVTIDEKINVSNLDYEDLELFVMNNLSALDKSAKQLYRVVPEMAIKYPEYVL